MTGDERRSAALLFARELRSGALAMADIDVPEVAAAVRSRRFASWPARRYERFCYLRGRRSYADDSVAAFAAARKAVLGDGAPGPPRLLVRVDEFPNYDSLDEPERHGTAAFQEFHARMQDAGVPYLVAAQAAVAADPLNPEATGGRPLNGEEASVLRGLAADGVAVGLHGYDHRSRFRIPFDRSEIEGLSPAGLAALLDRGMDALAGVGFSPAVFVPPFNTFDRRQYAALAERFDVVCGGPESACRLGYHRTPLWRDAAVYLPSYWPYYQRAAHMRASVEAAIEHAAAVWLPLTLHWEWELEAGWTGLEELLEAVGPCVRPWSEFLDEVAYSRAAGSTEPA